MKEFYAKANSLLKIKRSNPVVTKVQREDENGDTQIFEDKTLVEGEIANYFSGIYKRPDYRRQEFRSVDFNVEDDDDMRIDTNSSMSVPSFTKEEVYEASKVAILTREWAQIASMATYYGTTSSWRRK